VVLQEEKTEIYSGRPGTIEGNVTVPFFISLAFSTKSGTSALQGVVTRDEQCQCKY
jgi:hypothetical protein